MLEARLNAACSAYASFLQDKKPESHFQRALLWFAEAGITEAVARTFVGEIQAPLGAACRIALTSLFEMLWAEAQPAPEADRLEYGRLCRAESPDFILNLPEYYAFFTYTMFAGRVSK